MKWLLIFSVPHLVVSCVFFMQEMDFQCVPYPKLNNQLHDTALFGATRLPLTPGKLSVGLRLRQPELARAQSSPPLPDEAPPLTLVGFLARCPD